jgi:hypothetical protein
VASRTARLKHVLTVFRRWLYLPDPGMVEIALATVAANRIPGDPVWLLLTGPSSSGKTETLNSLLDLPNMHPVSTLTEAALLSGTPGDDRAKDATGGLLREIGEFGIIVPKDFTSILSMHRNTRQSVLAALREIYDGAWTRCVGVDGGKKLHWRGKVGLIGGVTSAIDSAHAVLSSMGHRFVLYRLPPTDGRAQAQRAIEKTGAELGMRVELTGAVSALFDGIDFADPPLLSDTDQAWIVALTTLVARCRSAVERDGYGREIVLIHDSEAPARLTKMLVQLLRGARLIGVRPPRARELILKVGFDCIPPVRRLALEALLKQSNPLTTAAIAQGTGYPEQTIRRALQELECHGIVEPGLRHSPAETWRVASHWKQQFDIARGAFPKCR